MIKSKEFIKQLKKNNVNFFTGVPDSLFLICATHLQKLKIITMNYPQTKVLQLVWQ